MDFNIDTYILLVQRLKDVYAMCKFNDLKGGDIQICRLRHDVDLSPKMALEFGRLEKKLDVRTSYFFHPESQTYDFYSDGVQAIMRELKGMGHSVGLHVDFKSEDINDAIIKRFDFLDSIGIELDRCVSFHKPTDDCFVDLDVPNTYAPKYMENYFSDSNRSGDFYDKVLKLADEGRGPIQVLTHPVWWSGHTPFQIENILRTQANYRVATYLKKTCNIFNYPGENYHEPYCFGI